MKKITRKDFMKSSISLIAMTAFSQINLPAHAASNEPEINSNSIDFLPSGHVVITLSTGESVTFFKQDNIVYIQYENGTTLKFSETIVNNTPPKARIRVLQQYSGWVYYRTDQYRTNIDWSTLNVGLTIAEIAATLSVTLGIGIAIATWIASNRASYIYRVDDTYYMETEPRYMMVRSYFYSDMNYNNEVGTDTTYLDYRL